MAVIPESRCPVLGASDLDLYAEAAILREVAPAVRVELPGGVVAWSVTRHAVIRKLTSDPRISRDYEQHWPERHAVSQGWALAPVAFQRNFFNTYGPRHHRLRALVAPSFAAHRVAALRPRIQSTAQQLVDRLAALAPGAAADLRSAYAFALTMTVICDLFGLPEHQRAPLGATIDDAVRTDVSAQQSVVIAAEITSRFDALIDDKRAAPGPDLTTDLITHHDAGTLSDEELRQTLFLMIAAGYETTVNLITSAAYELLAAPEHLQSVRAGKLDWTDVVEESLRYRGPAMHLPLRYAIQDVDLGEGVVIRQGEPIILAFAAAGRDPETHRDQPDCFDPARADKEHLAFGFGPHFCLGAHLARLEAEIALRTLFTSLPGLALAEPGFTPAFLPTFMLNGFTELPVIPVPVVPVPA
jgi:cytochrome P450